MCLPHIDFLVNRSLEYKSHSCDPDMFADIIFRCCWYLYESERCHEGLPLADFALELLRDQTSLAYAQGTDVFGLLWLNTNRPKKALKCFYICLRTRERLLPPNDAFIAVALNHVSLAYTELRDFKQAATYQQRAMDIRLKINCPLIDNSYSNMASILLGLGKLDEAGKMFKRCFSFKDITAGKEFCADNPRFPGDMMLLSKIRHFQGKSEESFRLASRTWTLRQRIFGDKYKTCDPLYQTADSMSCRDPSAAVSLLKKSLKLLQKLPESEGFMARAYFKLWELHGKLGSDSETRKRCKEAALSYRSQARTELNPGEEYSEQSFGLLVPWKL
ncbi:hypothetical protein AJ80_08435 [Polytolypa hystricis UAMH7299]|uniref:Uncharacterized protein n=1 Tax=Polytolypa hystricis (strain UAMH7299) TaxID=1447883 RepID=A0A2B7X745_POLH7|nr:hypothetical protein AJ80_08435 [Polytolypa hystricis UAMH7299]